MTALTATILSDGAVMDPRFELLSLETHHVADRIPWAELRLIDGDSAARQFAISDSGFFEPGSRVEIRIRREGSGEEDVTLFEGPAVRQVVESTDSGSTLLVELRDPLIALTGARQTRVFRDMTDRQAIAKILKQAGLEEGSLPSTEPTHAELVQYDCTDWDFILCRAEAQGLRAAAWSGELTLSKAAAGKTRRVFEWGIDIFYGFELELDTSRQLERVESLVWDSQDPPNPQRKMAQEPADPFADADGGAFGRKLGLGGGTLRHPVPLAPEEVTAWVDGHLARQRGSMVRGRLSVPGLGELRLLDRLELRGIGEHWNGETTITGVHHQVNIKGWQTHLEVGVPAEPFGRRERLTAMPAAGLLPAASGLRTAIVAGFAEDPDRQMRVKVVLPAAEPGEPEIWARLAGPDAGEDHGFFFLPETGDEVVLAFLAEDPRHPVILGSLYGSKTPPPEPFSPPEAENLRKGIRTKSGATLAFVDGDKASVLIETGAKNRLRLDDDGESVALEDQHGNSICLSAEGISIRSKKDLKIVADGSVSIEGKKVDVK